MWLIVGDQGRLPYHLSRRCHPHKTCCKFHAPFFNLITCLCLQFTVTDHESDKNAGWDRGEACHWSLLGRVPFLWASKRSLQGPILPCEDYNLDNRLSHSSIDSVALTQAGKLLLRRAHDGRVLNWNVEDDDYLCTLQEAFEKVDPRLGFNIELKFVDHVVYSDEELVHALEAVLKVWFLISDLTQTSLLSFSS